MSNVYTISELTKVYKGNTKKANDHISFTIQEGEIFGLLGPNGAGKSTLINQIAGLTRPTSGSIHLYGMEVTKSPHIIPEYVALQTQQMSALRDVYPEEALRYTAQLRGCSRAEARRQTKNLIEELGLGEFREKLIRNLSGGQCRLIHLALTFVGDRPIQIFDEPTNDLDPVVRLMVWEKLFKLNRQGKTIILVTHNVLEAERIIQRVGIINHGQLLAIGGIGELKERVDQRIRLELLLKAEYVSVPAYRDLFALLGEVHNLTLQHVIILCRRDSTRSAIDLILLQIGIDKLDDFRIQTPSLEDVYLQLGGGGSFGS
ncbi:ABC transporter ATP-binding protein [Dictyobacter arantiisoli]|uniref:ABC transporter ATP-binding protein n=1 Tax=Dictyobacter arantiisoli TaxID=2014874 RepID=A0A5A5TES0_9CHLR|nr:ABC transporter ATP-binding protein [Dictyobacter arantiisoli]GCF09827.1 ABC transporter ATP-binding protein [Dictyobacter arantiisoli]